MRRKHSSHIKASPGAEASVKAARTCAPRSGRRALTDAGAEGTAPQISSASPYLTGDAQLLIVPDHCSAEVVSHCNKKTDEILALSPALPYVTSDFHVLAVGGHKFLSAEIAELASKGGFQVEASDYVVEDSELTLFSQTNNVWTENLERKLKKLPTLTEDSERKDLSDRLLGMYLEGSNAAQFYEDNFPNIADRVRFLKQQRQKALQIDSKLKALTISGTREEFETELATSVPSLGRSTARTLSYAAVAEWLMLCPLDPKG